MEAPFLKIWLLHFPVIFKEKVVTELMKSIAVKKILAVVSLNVQVEYLARVSDESGDILWIEMKHLPTIDTGDEVSRLESSSGS